MSDEKLTSRRLMDAGLSKSLAYLVAAKGNAVSVPLALWLLDEHRITVPPLAGKTKRQIDFLRQMYAPKAPQSVLKRLAERERAV